jgi:hypothetical protein
MQNCKDNFMYSLFSNAPKNWHRHNFQSRKRRMRMNDQTVNWFFSFNSNFFFKFRPSVRWNKLFDSNPKISKQHKKRSRNEYKKIKRFQQLRIGSWCWYKQKLTMKSAFNQQVWFYFDRKPFILHQTCFPKQNEKTIKSVWNYLFKI